MGQNENIPLSAYTKRLMQQKRNSRRRGVNQDAGVAMDAVCGSFDIVSDIVAEWIRIETLGVGVYG